MPSMQMDIDGNKTVFAHERDRGAAGYLSIYGRYIHDAYISIYNIYGAAAPLSRSCANYGADRACYLSIIDRACYLSIYGADNDLARQLGNTVLALAEEYVDLLRVCVCVCVCACVRAYVFRYISIHK